MTVPETFAQKAIARAAGMSYVMAEVMDNDGPLAGRIVALSTLLSAVTIPIIMAIGL